MMRIPWGILLALLVGLGLGLVYAWVISPLRVTDSEPVALRADFKDQYRSAIAAAYAATGNLARAQARLALIGDSDPMQALNAQAQRMLASGQSFEEADQVAALASALDQDGVNLPRSTPTNQLTNNSDNAPTSTVSPPSPETPVQLTDTPPAIDTQTTPIASTPRPPRTTIPTPGEPFALTGQESVCDPNLPDGLLQVTVLNSNRRQLPGIEIVITWEGGREQFFTGLKPELGNGYADYSMAPNTTYTIQLARGSDVALDISAPTCQTPSGETFLGGIKIIFQQP